jgi:hypothetical protein
MRTIAVIVLTLWVTPLHAHCYSVWKYPTPQHCTGVYARAASNSMSALNPSNIPTPPDRPDRVNFLLPDLSAVWVTDDNSEGMLRLKALRVLSTFTVEKMEHSALPALFDQHTAQLKP